jgi:hypothetical protein
VTGTVRYRSTFLPEPVDADLDFVTTSVPTPANPSGQASAPDVHVDGEATDRVAKAHVVAHQSSASRPVSGNVLGTYELRAGTTRVDLLDASGAVQHAVEWNDYQARWLFTSSFNDPPSLTPQGASGSVLWDGKEVASLFGDHAFAIAWTDGTKLAFDPNSILLEVPLF